MRPEVSSIIAAYNAERYIRACIDSVLAQDTPGNEILIVDDASTDSTGLVLKEYGNRIRVITLAANGGPSRARNLGVSQSNGRYVAFLDSDDVWLPGKLEASVAALERNPRASLTFTEYINIDSEGASHSQSSIGHAPSMDEMLCKRPPIIPSTWVVPRHIFERTGGFSEQFKGAGLEDSWMVILLRELGEFEYLPQPLTLYRTGESGKIADKYGLGLPIFIRLARERYGSRCRSLVRNAKTLQCRWMLSKVAYQMNQGNRMGAIRTLLGIACLRPHYFFSDEFISRLLLSQNMQRVRAMTAIFSRAR